MSADNYDINIFRKKIMYKIMEAITFTVKDVPNIFC